MGPPRRLLKYNPTVLHAYGWIPLIPLRNLKATAFYDYFLWSQVGGQADGLPRCVCICEECTRA